MRVERANGLESFTPLRSAIAPLSLPLRVDRLTSNSLDEVAHAAVFRSNPRIERVPLENGESCYVVDDALHEPERFVE